MSKAGQKDTQPHDFDMMSPRTHPDGETDPLLQLEKKLKKLEKERRAERFGWAFIIIIIIDLFGMEDMQNFFAVIGIFSLEFIFLIYLANRLGLKEVSVMLNKRFPSWRQEK